ncbi:glycoside hydrolase family 5 protein [Modestobacter sp. SYSU DS0875]
MTRALEAPHRFAVLLVACVVTVTACTTAPTGQTPEVVRPTDSTTGASSAAKAWSAQGVPGDPSGDLSYLRGVNAAGGEFGTDPSRLPGVVGIDYRYNDERFYETMRSRGHALVRIPFRWERIQRELYADLTSTGVEELRRTVEAAGRSGLHVLLDMHNYGNFVKLDDETISLRSGIPADAFADVWTKLVNEFRDQSSIIGWGLMNEPGDAEAWRTASQSAVDAIRATGDARRVIVAGVDHSGAQRWDQQNPRPWIVDALNRVVYEAHYYFSLDGSGIYPGEYRELEIDARTRGYASLVERVTAELRSYTDWLAKYDQVGLLGEVGWPSDEPADYSAIGEHVYDLLDDASVSATYWATGTFWSPTYRLNCYRPSDLMANAQAIVVERHGSA